MDWHHPDSQGNTWDYPGNIGAYDDVAAWIGDEDKRRRYKRYLCDFALPQVKELLEKYGDVGVMWFDCGHKLTAEQGEAFIRQVREVQPDCLVNRRVWKEPYGDYGNTSDNQPHVRVPRQDWESIATLNDSWGYKATDHNWKTAEHVLRQMIDVVSMNGNFVINVGPMGDGAFDPKSVELLEQIGAWMRTNGEAIYGTQGSPIGKPPWGRCTRKEGVLYVHVFDWPQDGKLLVPGLRSPVVKAYALADPQRAALPVRRLSEDDVVVELPAEPFASCVPVVAIEFAGPCAANPVPLLQAGPAAPHVFGAFDADIAGPTLRYDTGKKDRDNLIEWNSLEDEATWTFRAGAPGSYKVFATYGAETSAAGAKGGAFELVVVSQRDGSMAARLAATVRPTGGMYEFAEFELGELVIPAAGEYVVRVKAAAIPGGTLMCLKQVMFGLSSATARRTGVTDKSDS
jgi:alpha-L-fucosidase